jgi:uncharacterized protein
MRSGLHGQVKMAESLTHADQVVILVDGEVQWDVESMQQLGYAQVVYSIEKAANCLHDLLKIGDHLIFMGNKSLSDLQDQVKSFHFSSIS